ncbi:DUF1566 domain-containing protein [Pseudomonas juntendi]|uniref:DUF1566 domain-containing protein n=1 Tax=Pseudomonas juntendi TaxID=2666183 RepID=UPI0018E69C6A|nr:DUF1566 domain-containing protein [Pseudomonas juntendi]MBI6912469.1 DUF1566 domain-containing protein [Pseudomonas juntendi]
MNTALKLTPPAIGEIWPGQGGIYAGIVPARNGAEAYHLIIGDELGRFEWGPHEVEAPATSLIDGQANTLALLESSDEYPAAKAAAAHQADGHNDFYLPAAAELYEAWLNLGYKDWGWVWSSSQRSANTAFCLDFDDGFQGYVGKGDDLRVRPVRRLPIQ